MNSEELRKQFLQFFENKGHRIVPSSSLIPENDPSVLFTTAGMQQFKLYYTGAKDPLKDNHFTLSEPLNNFNITTCQKCFRTSDIDEVGDERHLTFFEMLGNFSFGGYFKKDAIQYAWDFINKVMGIPLSRISISVFKGTSLGETGKEIPFDEESYNTWLSLGIPQDKIMLGSKEDNFWGPTGEEGPCGPTTEIYVDGIEIWNIVFNEYYQHKDKTLEPLKIKGVDTGMGLERLALIMQYPEDKTKTIFDTDLFKELINYLKINGKIKGEERIYRIIADHFRASAFLAASGVIPSNTWRGYVLRRLLRRIIRFSNLLELKDNWIKGALEIVKNKYSNFYPELNNQEDILAVITQEKDKFEKTLDKGLKEWQKLIQSLPQDAKVISGKEAFYLYESYGFPLELLEEMARELNKQVDKDGFEQEFRYHQDISRKGQEKKFGGHGIQNISNEEDRKKVMRLHTATHLLLQALRVILDEKIEQKGSDITPEKLRLDFPFSRKLTPAEIKQIEDLVNQKIQDNLIVSHYETTYEEAIKSGALGSFKDRYPEKVTVYEIKDPITNIVFSKEICAGPHVQSTKEIGHFKIIKEESVAQGIRRIKATVE